MILSKNWKNAVAE